VSAAAGLLSLAAKRVLYSESKPETPHPPTQPPTGLTHSTPTLATRRPRMQDQLIIWMALAGGTSRMLAGELSLHTRTAMVVAETLLAGRAKFTVTELVPGGGGGGGEGGELFLVECKGAGVQA
jgi:hypothetical protein